MATKRVFEFYVNRPPSVLTPNTRGQSAWQYKHRVGTAYAKDTGETIYYSIGARAGLAGAPYENGRLHSTHYFRGAVGDADNCIAALKPIIDVLKIATPRTGNRYQLGLLRDDRKLEVLAPTRVPSAGAARAGQIKITLEVW